MFDEDLTAFVDETAGFATGGTLDGTPVSVIFDEAGTDVLDGEAVTLTPSVLVTRDVAANANVGSALVVGGIDYLVRAVRPEPPDGAFVRLSVTRD